MKNVNTQNNQGAKNFFLCSAKFCSIAITVGIFLCVAFSGCGPPPPVPKAVHVKQVQQAIIKAGGETNILAESRILFARLSGQTNDILDDLSDGKWCGGLSGIPNLGDVFHYHPYMPDRIEVRIHNSHFDTYFIVLLNPSFPEPLDFERIAGNVGFIQDGNSQIKK